jgi:hypothetical protein
MRDITVCIVQRKLGRLSVVSTQYHEAGMFELTKSIQAHLARATNTNAPSLRYSIILAEFLRYLQHISNKPEVNYTQASVEDLANVYWNVQT